MVSMYATSTAGVLQGWIPLDVLALHIRGQPTHEDIRQIVADDSKVGGASCWGECSNCDWFATEAKKPETWSLSGCRHPINSSAPALGLAMGNR